MKEKDIIKILEDDKNYKDLKVPFEDGGGSTTYRELDFSKVALAILSKLKEKEIVLAKGIVKYGGTLGHTSDLWEKISYYSGQKGKLIWVGDDND